MKTFKFRTNSIICMGDSHSTDVTLQLLKKLPNDVDVWMCGDGGLGFGDISYSIDNALSWLQMFDKLCEEKNINLYHCRGNHDATYDKIWDSQWSNVFMIKNFAYGIFPNGKKSLFVGGGVSVDRYSRKEGIDYWKDEITPKLETVEKCDYVFSHDCPEHFNHPTHSLVKHYNWYVERDITLLTDCEKQRYNMSDICKRSEAKFWISGHFHNNIQQEIDGVKYRCLDIDELYEFIAS